MKKYFLLLAFSTFAQLALAATTYTCKIQESSGDTHVIDIAPAQKINLLLSASNMLLELTGSEHDGELDYPTAVGVDLSTNESEGGLIFDPSEIRNSAGQSVSVSCLPK